jgi:hypothetical protein
VNFVHVLDEQASHIGAVVAEARKRGVSAVEPTAAAEAAWVATIRAKAPDRYQFQLECTPGYYNNEGKPRERGQSFGDGPVAFHALLAAWRENGGMDEVM